MLDAFKVNIWIEYECGPSYIRLKLHDDHKKIFCVFSSICIQMHTRGIPWHILNACCLKTKFHPVPHSSPSKSVRLNESYTENKMFNNKKHKQEKT